MADKINPIRQTDDDARILARRLIKDARFGSLGVIEPATQAPMVTRVSVGTDTTGAVISLVSSLSQHTRALRENPAASVLVGEPGDKGDPLTHPRLSLIGRVQFVEHAEPEFDRLAEDYLKDHPKAKLYIGFGDFLFVRLKVEVAYLNGGFGKAFVLGPNDLH